MLASADVTDFTRYRNLPEVARYQGWPLPYTRDLAHLLVDDMDRLARPTPGEWVQLAVEDVGRLVGDVAVWLDANEPLAMIGYTLAPEHQHKGYATESLHAVIDWLFAKQQVHRIAASLDPRNHASIRVLERSGFTHVGTVRSAARDRGEWTDDSRWSLLAGEWEAWKRRPIGPVKSVKLVEITSATARDVGRLDVTHSQQQFVSSVLHSYADALFPDVHNGAPVVPWLRAIEADGDLAGFVMIAERTEHHLVPYLWRFLIDRRFQGRGVGTLAIRLLAERLREQGETHLELSFHDAPGGPEPFYVKLGFERTGRVDDGEIVARAALATILDRPATGPARRVR